MSAKRKPVTGSVVRAWARENAESIPEAARKGLGDKARGRLHPAIVTAFEAANPNASYVVGTKSPKTVTVRVTGTNKNGGKTSRSKEIPVSEARTLAGVTASKGRLSDAAVVAAGEALSAQIAASKSQS